MVRRSTTTPHAIIESIMDMLIDSINGLLDFIEMQLAHFMLKHISGTLHHFCDVTIIQLLIFLRVR